MRLIITQVCHLAFIWATEILTSVSLSSLCLFFILPSACLFIFSNLFHFHCFTCFPPSFVTILLRFTSCVHCQIQQETAREKMVKLKRSKIRKKGKCVFVCFIRQVLHKKSSCINVGDKNGNMDSGLYLAAITSQLPKSCYQLKCLSPAAVDANVLCIRVNMRVKLRKDYFAHKQDKINCWPKSPETFPKFFKSCWLIEVVRAFKTLNCNLMRYL